MTCLKAVARKYMEEHPMNEENFKAWHRLEYPHRYAPPMKQVNTVTRSSTRTYRPVQVAEALGIKLGLTTEVELTLSIDEGGNSLVVTTTTKTSGV